MDSEPSQLTFDAAVRWYNAHSDPEEFQQSESFQERMLAAGMMPVHPARRTTCVTGSTATHLLGQPGPWNR